MNFKTFHFVKEPKYENDSALLHVEFDESSDIFEKEKSEPIQFKLSALDLYTQTKIKMFRTQCDDPAILLPFKYDRPSLRRLQYLVDNNFKISNTIYTTSIYKKNGFNDLESMLKNIDWTLMRFGENGSRRIYVNNANTFDEYYQSESHPSMDVSCLVGIHYMVNKVILVFRASDLKNELFTDLVTITDSFILPIYKKLMPIDILISTAQNISTEGI